MNCTQCGAALSLAADRAKLECAHCAAEYVVPVQETTDEGVVVFDRQTETQCPCCHEVLHLAMVDKSPAEACSLCGGLLLEDVVFVQLVQSRRWAYRGPEQPQSPLDPSQLQRDNRCPACDGLMDRHPYNGPGNVVIDSCFPCRLVWLDAGELTGIERAPGRRSAY